MLRRRLIDFVEPQLGDGEEIVAAMAGFRPITRSAALMATFSFVLGGFAASSALGISPWIGGGTGGALGAGVAAWVDHKRARFEHDGKGLAVGLVVTGERLFILDLATGIVAASVEGVHLERRLGDLQATDTVKMQGSGLKRPGVVLRFADGTIEHIIPARVESFLEALQVE